MLLAIDVGNTQTVIGLFGPDNAPRPGVGGCPPEENKDGDLVDHWRIVTVAERTSDELALLLRQFLGWHGVTPMDQITGIAISSVVPSVTANLRLMSERPKAARQRRFCNRIRPELFASVEKTHPSLSLN